MTTYTDKLEQSMYKLAVRENKLYISLQQEADGKQYSQVKRQKLINGIGMYEWRVEKCQLLQKDNVTKLERYELDLKYATFKLEQAQKCLELSLHQEATGQTYSQVKRQKCINGIDTHSKRVKKLQELINRQRGQKNLKYDTEPIEITVDVPQK